MAYYGVGLPTAIEAMTFNFRHHISKANPLCTLSRLQDIFNKYDRNGNGKLDRSELDEVLKGVGMFLKVIELQALIKYFDRDNDGCLNFAEFLSIVKEPLNPRRNALVCKVYNQMGQQSISGEQLKSMYLLDNLTELMKTFIKNIRVPQQLDWDGFLQFHEELSMNIAPDDTFAMILSTAWNLDEKNEDTLFNEQLADSIRELKFRVIQRAGSVAQVDRVFREFDTNKSLDLSIDAFLILLKKLQLDFSKNIVNRVYRLIDQDNSGSVEQYEFIKFFNQP